MEVPAPAPRLPTPPPAPTVRYSWSEYNPNISVLYIRTHQEANLQLSKLGSHPQVLGFDLEWKPNFRKGAPENPVALVQLSNYDFIFLLQISSMQEFPSKLAAILANPLIVKAGVGIQNDSKKMYTDCRIPMYNCVDLSLLARTVDNARWKGKYNNPLGLARLVEAYEFRLLPKGRTTRSNWEATLDDLQIEYASNDAHAGYILYKKLEAMIPLLADPPKSIWYTFNQVSGQLVNSDGFPWHAYNPNYDPGPPPPPRIPREPKSVDGQDEESHSIVEQGDNFPSSRKRHRNHHQTSRRESEKPPSNDTPRHLNATSFQEHAQNAGQSSNGFGQHTRKFRTQYRSNAEHDTVFSTGSSAQSRDDTTHSSILPSKNRRRRWRDLNRP
ncbi:Werner syndrome ATP-dependent helicase [Psilocybe cubensis]|uniref:3'-5' exonuclease n=2 Tax=Psilocybe cubensis TaxID=181762 RepID=A0A8H7Y8T2_PSICU|nr:Werner syndrome ATP-dependent helicase [Psilocybe cubensis]KAH9487102.1 Werner syndrome ATP-dependent helicase [Psilocybe cubensis]